MKVKVIIPASGIGARFGGKSPKQFLKMDGKEMIALTLEKFHRVNSVDEIIISTRKEYLKRIRSIIRKYDFHKVSKVIVGGKLRQDSVYNGLMNLKCETDDLIMIHDAVRPYVSNKKILELIKEARKENCVILGLPLNETIKKIDKKKFVEKTVDRNSLWSIQTPQIFRYDILKKSFEKAMKDGFIGTDESAIVEYSGYSVKVIEGEKENIKITVREDVNR